MIHTTADVSTKATIGQNVKIWHFSQIREDASIGDNCILGKGVYIDAGVCIGKNVKIQNNVSVYCGIIIENGVFIGPHVCFTNDKNPRAVNVEGSLKTGIDWNVEKILVKEGASIGANATICPGVTIGKFAMIGAGSVVTKDVPDFALAYGNPAMVVGKVNKAGERIE